jgi:hypothetical protein
LYIVTSPASQFQFVYSTKQSNHFLKWKKINKWDILSFFLNNTLFHVIVCIDIIVYIESQILMIKYTMYNCNIVKFPIGQSNFLQDAGNCSKYPLPW